MRIVLLTGHHPRHFYVANEISKISKDFLVISSAMGLNPAKAGNHGAPDSSVIKWFDDRFVSEQLYFRDLGFNLENGSVLPVAFNEINSEEVYRIVLGFKPDIIVVYGTSILKGPLINITSKIINFHLGLSPYYNGAGTNWWPMYNNEYEYVGTTIHYLDSGVDTGEIIGQCRSSINSSDSPHDIGNKNIITGCRLLIEILPFLFAKKITPIKQWKVTGRKIYKMKEFSKSKLTEFQEAIKNGSIKNWVNLNSRGNFDIVDFNNGSPKLSKSNLLKPIRVK